MGKNLPHKLMVDDGAANGPKRTIGSCKGLKGGRDDNPPLLQKDRRKRERWPWKTE